MSKIEIKKTLSSFSAGTSGIYLINENYNFMLEALYSNIAEINNKGLVERTNELIVSPGIRYAIDIGDLQIVP